jgi:hypothetical protein
MQMKRLLSVNEAKTLITRYVDAIDVPRFRAAEVESRRMGATVEARAWPRMWAAIPAAIAAIALVAFAPAVVAQVQRVIQAFTIVNGRPTEVPVREVSLEELRTDMPFSVVPPENIPPNLHEEISEIGTGSSARAMFRFSAPSGPPVLTILENSAANDSPTNFMMRYGPPGRMPALPPAAPPQGAVPVPGSHDAMVIARNGMRTRVTVTPITWVAHGTRISLIAMPGALNRAQLSAILRSMR